MSSVTPTTAALATAMAGLLLNASVRPADPHRSEIPTNGDAEDKDLDGQRERDQETLPSAQAKDDAEGDAVEQLIHHRALSLPRSG